MGAAMNPPSTPDTPDRRKGRWQLILILMMVIGPMALATFMYKLQFWVPDSRSYHGELIGNGQTRADIGVQRVGVDRHHLAKVRRILGL